MLKFHALCLVCSLSVFYAVAAPVQAGAIVELRLADLTGTPMDAPSSGFSSGDQFLVELWLKPDQDMAIRDMSFDYRASSPELIPGFGLDIDTVNQAVDGVPNFWFDYTSTRFGTYPASGFVEPFPGFFASTAADYADFSDLISPRTATPEPVGTVTTNTKPGGNLVSYTGGVFNRVGGMPVTIPMDINPGVFFVDLLNSPDGRIDRFDSGSSLTFGFGLDPDDPVTVLGTATDSSIVHGPLGYAPDAGPLAVPISLGQAAAPEPASILLLAFGSCFVMRSISRRNRFA